MKRITVIVLIFAFATAAHARLTEKESELITRFGKVEMRTPERTYIQGRMYEVGTNLHFTSEQWHITALVIDDRCAVISYTKVGDWSEEQIVGILGRNGGYATFKQEQTNLGKSYRKWTQADGVTAVFSGGKLELTHPLYARKLAVLKAKAEADSKRPPKF